MPGRGTVLFVLKGYPRLSETFIAQEILGLEQAGLAIAIMALRHPTETRSHPITREIAAPVAYLPEYLHHEPLRVLKALAGQIATRRFWHTTRLMLADLAHDMSRNRLRRFGQALVLAAERPADVTWLHAHFIHTPASVTRYAAHLTGLPWSCSAHAKDIWTSRRRDLAGKLAEARWTTTCTGSGAAHLSALAPRDKPVHLIYHGLDLARFRGLALPDDNRDGSAPTHPVRLLSVGRAVEKKGYDLLLAALASLPPGLNWRLTHIGGGDQLAALKRQAEKLGLAGRIEWLGPQAQEAVLARYRAADLFVLPCRIAGDGDRDGLPNVLMEAQSQGLACLSTTVSAIPELIVSGETGLLVPPDDAAALADALAGLIGAPAERRRLGAAGEARLKRHFGHRTGIARLAVLFGLPGATPERLAAE